MTKIDEFFKAQDLDDLLSIRREIQEVTEEDARKIVDVLDKWEDEQAVYNLLIHSSLIPEGHRIAAVDRALFSREQPYFVLAVVVGLPGPGAEKTPDSYHEKWLTRLLELVKTEEGVLGSRTSVTIAGWLEERNYKRYLEVYPASNETASKNIISFALSKFGDLPRQEFNDLLEEYQLDASIRDQFLGEYDQYHAEIKEKGSSHRRWPLYSYIPNYVEFRTA